MIAITRDLARRFRAVARKCVTGRPRAPAPAVVFEAKDGTLTVWTKLDEVELIYAAPADGDDAVVVPMQVLEAVGAGTTEPVVLRADPDLQGTASWDHRGSPQTLRFDAVLPGRQHRPPDIPTDLAPVPAAFLSALHACGRSAARDPARFAPNRIQVKGKAGQVVGTDGRAALLWGGFRFPFPGDVLVPAVPAFGSKELADQGDVRVGLADGYLVVAVGPWTIRLPVDRQARYPDVAGAVPKPLPPSVAGIDDHDAKALLASLPGLPGGDDDDRPVTLALDGGVRVLAAGSEKGGVRTVCLPNSPAVGPAARVVVDRRHLARALSLGCLTLRLAPGMPVVAEGGERTFVFMPLDESAAVPSPADATRPTTPPRRTSMKPTENGCHNGRDDPPADLPDPLAEAEALRAALADAAHRANRLVALLKHARREKKALASVWAGLKQLNLDPKGGGP